jgi:hypothetical protein
MTVQECLEHPWLKGALKDDSGLECVIPSAKYHKMRDRVRTRYVCFNMGFIYYNIRSKQSALWVTSTRVYVDKSQLVVMLSGEWWSGICTNHEVRLHMHII